MSDQGQVKLAVSPVTPNPLSVFLTTIIHGFGVTSLTATYTWP